MNKTNKEKLTDTENSLVASEEKGETGEKEKGKVGQIYGNRRKFDVRS